MREDEGEAVATDGHLRLAARKILFSRQAFRTVLPTGFVHDPTLELLLLLYVADGDPVSIGEMENQLGIIGTVHRWFKVLAQHGLIDDIAPRVLLTSQGRTMIEEGLETILDAQMKAKP